jgi:hypothetical protein
MLFANAFANGFGQTNAANLDEADNNQAKDDKAEAFVADSIDGNSKNRNDD